MIEMLRFLRAETCIHNLGKYMEFKKRNYTFSAKNLALILKKKKLHIPFKTNFRIKFMEFQKHSTVHFSAYYLGKWTW